MNYFKKNMKFIIALIIFSIIISLFFYVASGSGYPGSDRGIVLGYSKAGQGNADSRYSYVDVKITTGDYKDKTISVQNFTSGQIKDESSSTDNFASPGDEVILNIETNSKGNITSVYISDIVRYKYIYILSAVFMVLIILLGGAKGLRSLIALIFTGIIVLKIMMPLILTGFDPIKLSIVICVIVTIVNLIIINGKNKKTYAAIVGTIGGLFISGIIAFVSNSAIRVKGLTDEEVQSLIFASHNPNLNIGGLLFAAAIMGALGAVMDVSISIASSMNEIRDANIEIGVKDLIKSGINVGRDIMGSMSNTLILAYAGGAMYLMLMLASANMGLSQTINQDVIAAEIIKGLAGSIGLIFAIPLTAVSFALLAYSTRKGKNN